MMARLPILECLNLHRFQISRLLFLMIASSNNLKSLTMMQARMKLRCSWRPPTRSVWSYCWLSRIRPTVISLLRNHTIAMETKDYWTGTRWQMRPFTFPTTAKSKTWSTSFTTEETKTQRLTSLMASSLEYPRISWSTMKHFWSTTSSSLVTLAMCQLKDNWPFTMFLLRSSCGLIMRLEESSIISKSLPLTTTSRLLTNSQSSFRRLCLHLSQNLMESSGTLFSLSVCQFWSQSAQRSASSSTWRRSEPNNQCLY